MLSFFTQKDILLRIAVAFAFLYPAIDALLYPDNWVDFFPSVLRAQVPDMTLLITWSIFEAILALWILSGKHIFWPSIIATILLCLIVVTNLPLFDLLFRDLVIALIPATLAWQAWSTQASHETEHFS